MEQAPQIGERVVLDITEPCLAHLPKRMRVVPGRIRKINIRHMDAPEFEEVEYTIRLDRHILALESNREWSVRAKLGEWPAQLTMENTKEES